MWSGHRNALRATTAPRDGEARHQTWADLSTDALQDWFLRPLTMEKLDSSSASSLPTNEACSHRKPPNSMADCQIRRIEGNRLTASSSVQTMQNYIQPALNAIRNPSTLFNRVASEANSAAQSPANVLQQVRNMPREQWYSMGVVVAEVIGFFSVGEIIGRFKLVGYRTKSDEHH